MKNDVHDLQMHPEEGPDFGMLAFSRFTMK